MPGNPLSYRAIRRVAAAVLLAGLIQHAALAQPSPADPDWPCAQPLVPQLTAGSYWSGAPVPVGDYSWRDSPALTRLVQTVTDRATPDAAAVASLRAYEKSSPKAERGTKAARLFGFILGETNDERDLVIERIDQLSRRQRNLDGLISAISAQIDAIPADAGTQRADLAGQRDFNIRTFQEAQSTIRYACEVPAAFDRRLGLIAATLQDATLR